MPEAYTESELILWPEICTTCFSIIIMKKPNPKQTTKPCLPNTFFFFSLMQKLSQIIMTTPPHGGEDFGFGFIGTQSASGPYQTHKAHSQLGVSHLPRPCTDSSSWSRTPRSASSLLPCKAALKWDGRATACTPGSSWTVNIVPPEKVQSLVLEQLSYVSWRILHQHPKKSLCSMTEGQFWSQSASA